jgi:hypothetical protein
MVWPDGSKPLRLQFGVDDGAGHTLWCLPLRLDARSAGQSSVVLREAGCPPLTLQLQLEASPSGALHCTLSGCEPATPPPVRIENLSGHTLWARGAGGGGDWEPLHPHSSCWRAWDASGPVGTTYAQLRVSQTSSGEPLKVALGAGAGGAAEAAAAAAAAAAAGADAAAPAPPKLAPRLVLPDGRRCMVGVRIEGHVRVLRVAVETKVAETAGTHAPEVAEMELRLRLGERHTTQGVRQCLHAGGQLNLSQPASGTSVSRPVEP